jgi:hypothetical protein
MSDTTPEMDDATLAQIIENAGFWLLINSNVGTSDATAAAVDAFAKASCIDRMTAILAAVQGDDQGAVNTVQAVVCRQAREKLEAMGVKMTD